MRLNERLTGHRSVARGHRATLVHGVVTSEYVTRAGGFRDLKHVHGLRTLSSRDRETVTIERLNTTSGDRRVS